MTDLTKINMPFGELDGGAYYDATPGMTLRDYFAGQALQGILAGGYGDTVSRDDISGGYEAAHYAYHYADAMIAARNK